MELGTKCTSMFIPSVQLTGYAASVVSNESCSLICTYTLSCVFMKMVDPPDNFLRPAPVTCVYNIYSGSNYKVFWLLWSGGE